jgi:hypothetical protein
MKKYVVLGLMVLLLVGVSTCARESPREINITVDPRIELLAAVQILGGYGEMTGLITRYDFEYKQEIIEYFDPYKRHPAVAHFKQLASAGFAFDAPAAAMLYLSNPPELEVIRPFSEYLISRAWGEDNLMKLVNSLRDFAIKTDFMTFFNNHRETYDHIVGEVKATMTGSDYIATLEDYYGVRQNSYNIILAPLFHHGGFGPRLTREDGTYDIYNICGPVGAEGGYPIFGSAEDFKYLAWHEFSHSFINPLTDKFLDDVNQYKELYKPLAERMTEMAYPDWKHCVYEHLVRAANVRFSYLEDGEKAGRKSLREEKNDGFAYVELIAERLKEYEDNRDMYPTLEDFYPRIIDLFKELSEMNLGEDFYAIPFAGTINAALGDKTTLTIILPTNEDDKDAQDRIHTYVKGLKKSIRSFANADVITDSEALEVDLSSRSLIVYGTPDGNLWLAKHMKYLPVKIEVDKIVADTDYTGEHLRFMTAWPNPYNPRLGMVIYTACKAQDLIGINSIFHGPTDYLVASGDETLHAADYDKDGDKWSF